MKNMGMGIDKRKYTVCVVEDGNPGGIILYRCVIFRRYQGTNSDTGFPLPAKSRQLLNDLHKSGTVPADLTAIRSFIPFFYSGKNEIRKK